MTRQAEAAHEGEAQSRNGNRHSGGPAWAVRRLQEPWADTDRGAGGAWGGSQARVQPWLLWQLALRKSGMGPGCLQRGSSLTPAAARGVPPCTAGGGVPPWVISITCWTSSYLYSPQCIAEQGYRNQLVCKYSPAYSRYKYWLALKSLLLLYKCFHLVMWSSQKISP